MPRIALGRIGQLSRSVANIGDAVEWYAGKLGLPHLYTFGTLAFFDCDGVRLLLSEEPGGMSNSILYFRVVDIASAYQDLTARGIAFTQAPGMIHRHDDGTEEWMAFFKDNEGRPLAIMQQKRAA